MFIVVMGIVGVKLQHILDVEGFPGTLNSLNITILFKIITISTFAYAELSPVYTYQKLISK